MAPFLYSSIHPSINPLRHWDSRLGHDRRCCNYYDSSTSVFRATFVVAMCFASWRHERRLRPRRLVVLRRRARHRLVVLVLVAATIRPARLPWIGPLTETATTVFDNSAQWIVGPLLPVECGRHSHCTMHSVCDEPVVDVDDPQRHPLLPGHCPVVAIWAWQIVRRFACACAFGPNYLASFVAIVGGTVRVPKIPAWLVATKLGSVVVVVDPESDRRRRYRH
mmetsp:Transcript_7555/g.15469  ORF Transcript_7555/g.15469 Transcript_7555/m.15469 type:complete len:222 (+) Transcript_7555:53-718(+)